MQKVQDNLIVYKFGQNFYYVDQGNPSNLFMQNRTMIQDQLDIEDPGAYQVRIRKSALTGNVKITHRKIV